MTGLVKTPEVDQYLSPTDVAKILGYHSRYPIYRLIREGRLPVVRVGPKTLRIPLSAVKALMGE